MIDMPAFVRRHWLLLLMALLVVSLFFNHNFRATLSRKRAIQEAQKSVAAMNDEIQLMKQKIDRLQTRSSVYEAEVRKDLGYLRPGEKEIRFIKAKRP